MKEDIAKIITMLQEGKIDNEEASELISALKEKDNQETRSSSQAKNDSGKLLKVLVQSDNHENVNIKLPVKLIKGLLKMGHSITKSIPQTQKYADEIDTDVLISAIDQNVTGKIIDITSSNGDLVTIYIE